MQPERRPDGHVILCLNRGSSSLKFALYRLSGTEETRLTHGAVERIGLSDGHLWLEGADDTEPLRESCEFPDHGAAVAAMFGAAARGGFPHPVVGGHRVVHGGPVHSAPERVEAPLLAELHRLVAFAPLHLTSEIQGIEAVAARFPGLPQLACFDTAFHRRMPELAQRLPLPHDLWDEDIRRYGFHGLSFEYIVASLGATAQGHLMIAHLGTGANLAAVYSGAYKPGPGPRYSG
jgi:acetate kinase